MLDQVAGAAALRSIHVEERGVVGDAFRLLQVVRDDRDREFLLQLPWIDSSIFSVAIGSRAEQGSSMRSTSGSVAMARAMHNRCCCPPEKPNRYCAACPYFVPQGRPAQGLLDLVVKIAAIAVERRP